MFSVRPLTGQSPICLSFLLLWAPQPISSKSERRIKVSKILSSWKNPENDQLCKGGKSWNCICLRKGHAQPFVREPRHQPRSCGAGGLSCPAANFCYPCDGNSQLILIKNICRSLTRPWLYSALMLSNHCIILPLYLVYSCPAIFCRFLLAGVATVHFTKDSWKNSQGTNTISLSSVKLCN